MAATVLLALAVTPGVGWLLENLYDERAARAAVLEQADDGVRREMLALGWAPISSVAARGLKESHGVEILAARSAFSIELANGPVRGQPPRVTDGVVAIVAAELSRYPRAFLEAARLRRVTLCSQLSEGDVAIPSLPNFHRTLLFDVDAEPSYLRRLVHHEVFHFADYADDDQVQSDPEWAALNDRWFVYGPGGRFTRQAESSRKTDLAGFVTLYARSALEEDKAETFAFSMVDPRWVAERSERDPVLARKVAAARRQLERLSPSLDARFWSAQAP